MVKSCRHGKVWACILGKVRSPTYCKTVNVGQQLSLTKLTMPVESLNLVSVPQFCSIPLFLFYPSLHFFPLLFCPLMSSSPFPLPFFLFSFSYSFPIPFLSFSSSCFLFFFPFLLLFFLSFLKSLLYYRICTSKEIVKLKIC